MSDKKIIVVFGATGNQGGGAVDWLLKDGEFAVRAVTRNKTSDKAKKLAERGVEVVEADLDDVESLKTALQGAYGVFGVTDFWSVFQKEVQQGKNLVDAAKATGIQHFVWSSLDHCELPHFETKAQVDDYLKASGVPRTTLLTCAYTDNSLGPMWGFKKDPENEGGVVFENPFLVSDAKIPIWYSGDTGAYALAALKNPQQYIGKEVNVVESYITPREWAATFSRVINAPVRVKEITRETFEQVRPNDDGMMLELWKTFRFYYNTPNLRGDPQESAKVLQEIGVTAKTAEDVFKLGGGWNLVQG